MWVTACASSAARPEDSSVQPEPILGVVTQEQVLAHVPEWVSELVQAQPEEAAARRLAARSAGVEVEVFFGSWCSDSRRELTRLWRALEMTGGEAGFPIRYIGVDRSKLEPEMLVEGREILYVPTLIVSRAGSEIGRIVESAPGGVESDLADLVEGSATGWLSGRDDLGASEPVSDRR